MHARCFAAVMLTLLMQALPITPARACEKTLRWNDDPPFSMRGLGGEPTGLQIELHRELLRRLGCSVRLLEMPWARALTELEAGRLDILPGAYRKPERELYAHFSQPVLLSRNMLFLSRAALQRWPVKRLLDLRGTPFRLGAQIGVHYGADYELLLQDAGIARRLERASNRRGLWQMLALDRIDGLIADELTGQYELREAGLSDRILMSEAVASDEPAATAFSRRSIEAGFVQAFDRVLAQMRQDGSYQAIVQRYTAMPKVTH